MAALTPIGNQGALQGFPNLFARETRRWWATRYWLVQLAVWLVIVNGAMALIYRIPVEQMYSSDPQAMTAADLVRVQQLQQHPELVGLTTFVRLAGLATAIGAVIIAQDALIGERQSGTAAWILSKPVSRAAVILSKLAGNALGMAGVMGALLGAVTYLQIWWVSGVALPLPAFAGMLGLIFLNQFFYLTLTLMLGALSTSRGLVIGVPIVLVFGYQILLKVAPALGELMPWNLVATLERPALALSAAQGQPLPTFMPLIFTIAWCALFSVLALWRFDRQEF